MSVRPDQDYCKKSSIEQLSSDYGEKRKKHGKFITSITYFAESTSFIGIAKMWASPRIALKLMWALFFLSATGMLIYQLVKLIGLFSTFPVKTSVKLGFSPLPFPSVTICNTNPIRLSKANELSCELQKALELEPKYQSEECVDNNITLDYDDYRQTEIICDDDICYEQEVTMLDKHYIRKKKITEYLTRESVLERKDAGHDIDTMLIECTLNGQICVSQNFTWLTSRDFGNCYTFDSQGVRAKNTGPETGLSMVVNLEPEEFISSFKTGYGLRVVVHSSGTRPFPDSKGFTASPGSETSITVKMTDIVRLPHPYGTCNGSTVFKKQFGVEYTQIACREFCVRGIIIDKCNCDPDAWESAPASTPICYKDKDLDCELETYMKYMADSAEGIDACTCGMPCNEKVFETNVFSRSWPLLAHVKDLEKQICEKNSRSPKCDYSDYDFHNVDLRTSSFLKLKVYYESLNFEQVKEEPFYDIERFLSDIGGTMGLWMGASLLSIAEFIEIFMELLCCCFVSGSN